MKMKSPTVARTDFACSTQGLHMGGLLTLANNIDFTQKLSVVATLAFPVSSVSQRWAVLCVKVTRLISGTPEYDVYSIADPNTRAKASNHKSEDQITSRQCRFTRSKEANASGRTSDEDERIICSNMSGGQILIISIDSNGGAVGTPHTFF